MFTLGPGRTKFPRAVCQLYVKRGAGMTNDDTHRKLLPDDTWKCVFKHFEQSRDAQTVELRSSCIGFM